VHQGEYPSQLDFNDISTIQLKRDSGDNTILHSKIDAFDKASPAYQKDSKNTHINDLGPSIVLGSNVDYSDVSEKFALRKNHQEDSAASEVS